MLKFINNVNIIQPYNKLQEIDMSDRVQFEAMLEALINEDQAAAKEIFHNIVVNKSREIYEELLESDFGPEEPEEPEEDEDEIADDSADTSNPFGATDDDEEPEEDEDEDEGELSDRVMDLEDALEDLKQEFEELMAGEENEPEHADMFGGEEGEDFDTEDDEFGGEEDEFGSELPDDEDEVKEVHMYHHDGDKNKENDEFEQFMEYVNKVSLPTHGDNGVQTRSAIAGKNDMGGTTANITKSFATQKGGTQGGLLNPSTQPQTGGNINVPGAKSASKLKPVGKGHGAEKKGTSDKPANGKSMIGSR